jgi:hypothetical protein
MPHPISSTLAALAPQHGLRLAAGPRFGHGGAFERHLRLPYSLDIPTLEAGLHALAATVQAARTGHPATDIPPTGLV